MTAQPAAYPEIAAFWEALATGRLLLKRCGACARVHYYPRAICPFCLADATEWTASTGRGRVHSFSIMRRANPPYCLAMVELDEGVTMMTNLVESDFDAIRIGAAVVLHVTRDAAGGCIPTFRLAPPASTSDQRQPRP